jgi:citrate synthase
LLVEPSRFAAALAQPSIANAVSVSLLGHTPSRPERRAIDGALILFADHELNASTFAARVAASAGADLHACLVAAMATLSGPRHGGACDRVEMLLADADALGPRVAVERRLAQGEVSAGFDAGAYPDGDPRAPPLIDLAMSVGQVRRSSREVIKCMKERTGAAPSCDFGLVVLTQALDMPPGSASALFALGRCAGWVAHVLEQRDAGVSIRPRARYVGS